MEYLFSYGTLCSSKVQQELFGRTLPMEEDELLGYELSPQKAYGHYLMVQKSSIPHTGLPGFRIRLGQEELRHADIYEGPEYQRVLAPLKSGKQAWVYVAKED